MRDLLFKNLTSNDKKRKILASCEVSNQDGLQTNIYRHLLCQIKDANEPEQTLPKPRLYILKKRDTKQKKEFFYCKIKGNMYLTANERLYVVSYVHSLKIVLKPAAKTAVI